MHDQIRRLEHRAEQLAIRLEELAEQPDVTRIAIGGIFVAIALCWFAVAWGEGLLLLALPLVAAGCIVAARRVEHDPAAVEGELELGTERKEIDEWLTRLTTRPARPDPEPRGVAFQAPAPSLDVRLPTPLPELELELEPEPEPAAISTHHEPVLAPAPAQPLPTAATLYEVCEIRAGARVLLEVRSTFDGAVDVAFELIEERDPPELEIVLVRGDEREIAWSYNREETEGRPRGTLDLFGFDATRWTEARR